MIRVAVSMKLRFSTLDTNGKLRDARRLHSITFTSLLRARNWILKGPEILSSFAIWRLIFLDAACRCKINLLCREYQRSVTGMYTGKLYVLGDGVFHHFTVFGQQRRTRFPWCSARTGIPPPDIP